MKSLEDRRNWTRKVLKLLGESEIVNGAPPVTAEENARLAKLSPEDLAKTDLTRGDMKVLFSEGYMQELAVAPIKGAGNPKLAELMREVQKGVSGPRRVEVMDGLAAIVGIPPTAERLDLDYGRFLVVRKQQETIGKSKNDKTFTLDEDMHPEFMASRAQLQFGQVVGDAFGIHKIFAALLNPTGGLVGPGNWLIPGVVKAGHLAPDNPMAMHGTVHDAGGYLLQFHDEGPGYNYRDSWIEVLGTDNPLSGQISGIAYWVKEIGDDYIVRRVAKAILAVEKTLTSVRKELSSAIDGMLAKARKKARGLVKGLSIGSEEVVEDVVESIQEAREKAERSAVRKIDTATQKIGRMRDTAKRKLDAAWDFLKG